MGPVVAAAAEEKNKSLLNEKSRAGARVYENENRGGIEKKIKKK